MTEPCAVCARSKAEGWNGMPGGTVHCGDAPRAGVLGCHATWRGVNKQHCVRCHHTFSGPSAEREFHHPKGHSDRCATDEELSAAAAVLRDGVWGWPRPDTTGWVGARDSALPGAENEGLG